MSITLKNRILIGLACLLLVILAACAPAQPTASPAPAAKQEAPKQEAPKPAAAAPTEAPKAAAPAAPAAKQEAPKAAPQVASVAPKAVTLGDFKCPKMGGTLTFALITDFIGPDPQTGDQGTQRRDVVNQIFDQLISPPLPGQTEYQPYLATKWEVSADGLTYTFTLRQNVKFHDGAPFNSAAVKANVERVQNEKTALLAAAFRDVTVDDSDPYKVVLKRKTVRATFLDDISSNSFLLISPKTLALGITPDVVNKNPAGTGPYKFSEMKAGESITLVRNTEWWGGQVCLDKVIFRVIPEPSTRILEMEAGSVQGMNIVPPDQVLRLSQNFDFYDWASCRVEGPVFNLRDPNSVVGDVKFREAFRYALDQQTILKAIDATGKFNVETAWLSPKGWFYDANEAKKFVFNAAKAKELWAAAGYKDTDGDGILNDKAGKNIELRFPNGNWNEFFAQAVQGELLKMGIKTKIEIHELASFLNNVLYVGNYDITLWSSQSETCDPSQMFEQLRATNQRNVPGIKDPKIDELMDAALATSNTEERKKRYRALIDYIEPMHIYAFVGEKYVIDNTAVSRKVKGFRQDRYRVFKMDTVWME